MGVPPLNEDHGQNARATPSGANERMNPGRDSGVPAFPIARIKGWKRQAQLVCSISVGALPAVALPQGGHGPCPQEKRADTGVCPYGDAHYELCLHTSH